jgi:alpha-D-ribose 1-methylphosphonate 5-triphosphate diphosphatase
MQTTYNIIDANIVTPQEVIRGVLRVENGIIVEIIPQNAYNPAKYQVEEIDANGNLLLPGIIDIHTDAIDKEIMPRKSADFPIDIAFRELERRMSGCGITTVYHSMHLGYKKAEESANSKYNRKQIFEAVYACTQKNTIINNKIHLRFELTGTYHYDLVLEVMKNGWVDLLSIMDHRPGQGQYGNVTPESWAKNMGLSLEQATQELEELRNTDCIEGERLKKLIDLAIELGISVASHDDDSIEKVEQMHAIGIDISEFPINAPAAKRALELGMHTVAGASNVIRGGSLSGNINVADAIQQGLIQSLCSDYYPPSILHALFMLVAKGILSYPEAANLTALNPAKAVKIDKETGSIEVGKKADLIIVELQDNLPLVTHTFVEGNLAASASSTQKVKEKLWM